MSIPTNLLEAPKMNSSFMMLAYHSAFELKDERLENYTPLDNVKNQAFGRCYCAFKVGCTYVASDLGLVHYYYLEHVAQ